MRHYALDDYRLRLLIWAVTAPYLKGDRRPPALPPILRDVSDDDA